MRILTIALKDLKQVLRDWKSALFLVIMPILFTIIFGIILAPGTDAEDPRLEVGVVDARQVDNLGESLIELLGTSETVRPLPLEGDDAARAEEMVQEGELSAVVFVSDMTVLVDRSTAVGQTAYTGIETAVMRLLGAVQTARISADIYAEQAGFENQIERQKFLDQGLDLAVEEWEQPPIQVNEVAGTGSAATQGEAPAGFAQSSPGMMVQFAIFGLITSAMVLMLERKTGALQRLLTTPTTRPVIIAGHVLAMFLVIFFQLLLLVAIGQWAFGVDYLHAPLAVLVMVVTLALWTASLGLLIGAISRRQEQVITLSLIAMFIFAALGGAWFPLDVAGETFATIGHLMPTAWAMDGLQNIIVRGQGFGSVLLPAGILLAYTTVFFGLAVWQFSFERP